MARSRKPRRGRPPLPRNALGELPTIWASLTPAVRAVLATAYESNTTESEARMFAAAASSRWRIPALVLTFGCLRSSGGVVCEQWKIRLPPAEGGLHPLRWLYVLRGVAQAIAFYQAPNRSGFATAYAAVAHWWYERMQK